jgi:type IV pilus assembly protein PilB
MTYSTPPNRRTRAVALRNNFSPFGNKLIEAGYLSREQLQQAMLEISQSGQLLTNVVASITGNTLPPDLIRQYKKIYLFELKIIYGLEFIDLDVDSVNENDLMALLETIIPIDLCRRYKLFPIKKEEESERNYVLIAMTDPDNLEAQDDLNRVLRSRDLMLKRKIITYDDYEKLLELYYQADSIRKKEQEEIRLGNLTEIVDTLDSNIKEINEVEHADLGAEEASEAPIINLVNRILVKALQEDASDIHIEPQEEYVRVRLRKDGLLQESFEPLPSKIKQSVVARLKIMADLDIAERRVPQDGKIRRIFQGRKVDFRVNTLPSRYGEKVVLRILDSTTTQLGLDKLITDQTILEEVRDMTNRPFGLILVTGPTGSGKSTTLYSMLAERSNPVVNVCTAEDPIEYSLPGITQVQVIREKGMDFASILRAFMRQDPDVILVGETRDLETAKTAMEAALTGHLVLTTLHTNDAASAIARLDEMGVETFMISGSLLGVVAQRLMRRVCSDCRVSYIPSREELIRYGFSISSQEADIHIYKAKTLSTEQVIAAKNNGELCKKCGGSGYKGRVGVYEVMQISERIEKLINLQATTDRIKEVAIEEGMITLLAYSLNLVRQGYTTLEEVERVTFTDSGLESELKAKRKTSLTCQVCTGDLQPEWLDCPYCLTPRFVD